jgi:aminopeptidase
VQAYIAVRGADNAAELSDVPGDKMKLYTKHWLHPVHLEHRVKKTKWCIFALSIRLDGAGSANVDEAFEDFFFRFALRLRRMEEAVKPLKALMEQTDHVHITGPGTDLQFPSKISA